MEIKDRISSLSRLCEVITPMNIRREGPVLTSVHSTLHPFLGRRKIALNQARIPRIRSRVPINP